VLLDSDGISIKQRYVHVDPSACPAHLCSRVVRDSGCLEPSPAESVVQPDRRCGTGLLGSFGDIPGSLIQHITINVHSGSSRSPNM
jgi:hypothetical protein